MVSADDRGKDSHVSGDRSNVDNDPSPIFSHLWDDELRESHWGEEIGFKRLAGNIQVYIQDRTYSALSRFPY